MKRKNDYYEVPAYKTLKEVIVDGAKNGADKKQFVFIDAQGKEQSRTFNEMWREITGVGTFLFSKGMKGHKKIAVLGENSYDWILAYYTVLVGGNITVPLDSKLPDEDLAEQLANCSCDAIIFSEKCRHTVDFLKAYEGTTVKDYYAMSDYASMKKEGSALFDGGETGFIDAPVNPDDIAAIVYTSGTTGKSKGVVLKHSNVAADVVASCRVITGSHAIGFLPLNHTLSWVSALFAGYVRGEWGYICNSLKNIQKDIQTYKPTNFAAVPLVVETIYSRIWKTAQKTGKEEILKKGLKISRILMKLGIDKRRKIFSTIIDNLGGNLEFIMCGGAYLDPKIEEDMYYFGIQIINGFGLTECSPAVTCNRRRNFKPGSVGLPLECCEIKINEPDDEGVGEIYIRGANVMDGYYNDPEATAQAFDGDWFKSGDYGKIDSDGFLYFVGRKKNLIVLSNGKNVSPEELEDKLMHLPYVAEVLVYEENSAITAEFFFDEKEYPDARARIKEDLRALNESLPLFKQITRHKIRDDEFPKTTTMKIVRNYTK